MTRHATVDLHDLLESKRDKIEDLTESRQENADKIEEEYGDYATFLEEASDAEARSMRNIDNAYVERIEELEAEVEGAEDRIDALDWGGSSDGEGGSDALGPTEFRVSELLMGDLARLEDEVTGEIQHVEDITEAQGAATVEALEIAVDRAPPEAPEVAEYPALVGQLLLEDVGRLSGMPDPNAGDGMGKSSLQELVDS